MPRHSFERFLKYLSEKEEYDIIILLGDLISQDSWNYHEKEVLEVNQYIYSKIKENFWGENNSKNNKQSLKDLENVDSKKIKSKRPIILPVNGNHDTEPLDFEDVDNPDNYTRKEILTLFKDFIGQEKVLEMQTRGFYVYKIPDSNLNFFGFDLNLSSVFNSYMSDYSDFPIEFLMELGKALYKAEKNGEKVTFLTHIPFSDVTGQVTLSRLFKILFQR